MFIDEAGSNIAMARPYARSQRGAQAHANKPSNWGDNLTMIGALGIAGLVAFMHIFSSTTGDVFLAFLRQVLVPVLRKGQVVIMDNLSSHRVAGVREAIESVGAKLLYLPPYSPDFNPIELCWAKMKGHLKAVAARTTDGLEAAIKDAFCDVTGENARNWFRHCGYTA